MRGPATGTGRLGACLEDSQEEEEDAAGVDEIERSARSEVMYNQLAAAAGGSFLMPAKKKKKEEEKGKKEPSNATC